MYYLREGSISYKRGILQTCKWQSYFMPFMREVKSFHSNLIVKMYLEFDVFPTLFTIIFFQGGPPRIHEKIGSWIWTNLKSDPENVKNRGILLIPETLTCLILSRRGSYYLQGCITYNRGILLIIISHDTSMFICKIQGCK